MHGGIIRLEHDGPPGQGLTAMALDPADFQSPLPDQHIHVYFADAAIGLSVGVWTTTQMQETFGPYPGDEFMLVLEGRVEMVDGDGHVVPVETGQTFVLRDAIPISWRQVGPMRKFFLLLQDPDALLAQIDNAEGGVIVPDEAALATVARPEAESIGGGQQRGAHIFTNDAGTMTVGLWDSTAFESAMRPFGVHEFCQVLQGRVRITEEDGTVHDFTRGDVFFVPRGCVCSWATDAPFRKYYAQVSAQS